MKFMDEPHTPLSDLESVYRVMEKLDSLVVSGDCYISDAGVKVHNALHDYPVGTVWWNSETETWEFTAHRDGVE